MPAFATVPDLRRHLNKTTNADDAELQVMLDAAAEVVQALIGTSFDVVAVTERVAVHGGTVLLSRRPVVGAVSFNGSPVDEGQINRAAGVIYTADPYPVAASVTYSTGSGVVPASVKLATLIIAAHLWETQRMPGQSADSRPAGFGGADGIPDATPFSGFAIPNRAQELLAQWLVKAQVG